MSEPLTKEQEFAMRANTTVGDEVIVHGAGVLSWRSVWATLDAARAALAESQRERNAIDQRCELAENRLAATERRVAALREALRPLATGVQELSYHGEAMECHICGSVWNNGRKRNDPATPEWHKPECLLAATPDPERET